MQHYNNNGHIEHNDDSLLRTHKQQTTQQVTTVTKVVREVKHLTGDNCIDGQQVDYVDCGPDGQPLDYVPLPLGAYPRSQYMNYNHHIESQSQLSSTGVPPQGSMYDSGVVGGNNGIYQEYEHYPVQYANSGYGMAGNGPPQGYLNEYGINERSGTPPSERSVSPSQLQLGLPSGMQQHQQHMSSVAYLQAPYDEMADYNATDEQAAFYGLYGTAGVMHPSAGGVGGANNPQTRLYAEHEPINGPVAAIRSRYATDDDDELQKHMQSQLVLHNHAGGVVGSNGSDHDDQQRQMRWRDPNLTEVISFLNNPNSVIVANAAAFLQHLCYMDDPNKQRTRTLGGIPPLVKLLSHEAPDVYRNACGALRNLSYGRQNDENKRAIKNAGGIPSLIQLLRRSSEADVKEIVTSVIWNLSSCEDLKRSIIDDGILVIVSYIVIPHSGWDAVNSGETCWSTVFRNASGVLRNVSSAGEYARTKLRDCVGLVDSLLYVVKSAIEKSNIGNKIVENCVCILRNLSYRCQEVEDPNYDKHPLPSHPSRSQATVRSENLGCFGGSKKKKDAQNQLDNSKDGAAGGGFDNSSNNNLNGNAGSVSGSAATIRVGTMGNNGSNEPIKGAELLWQPEVVQSYLALLQSCSNPETLEAAAGALQNLAACYWQPSIEIRAAVRKEKGLPILVELLRMEVDRVVCAVATALRNLAIDQRNKELIGKYAMRDLVQKLPSGNPQHDQSTSDDTIAAVLATLNEVIKKNAEFSRSLLDAGGVERLMNITRQKQKYTARVLKFGVQVLFTMWQHQELRDVYKKHGWKESDFVTKTVAARNGPSSPNNTNTNTLNRPFESQGRTRYEDRTIKRSGNNGAASATGTSSQNNLSIASNQNSLLQQAGNRGGSGGNLMLPPIYQRGDEIPIDMSNYQQDPMNLGGMQQQQQGGTLRYGSSQGMTQQGNGPPSISLDICDGMQMLGEPVYAQINRLRANNLPKNNYDMSQQHLSNSIHSSSLGDKHSDNLTLVGNHLVVYQNSEEISKTSSNSWI